MLTTRVTASDTSKNPDHIYVDATFYNNSYTTLAAANQYIPAQIYQQRDSPYLYNPELYNMTVTRFSISGDYLGRAYQSLATTTGPTGTRLWVSLSYNGVYYDEPIVIPTINAPQGGYEKVSVNIFGFLSLVNAGFLAAQNAVIAAGATCPYGQVMMTFDPATALYSVNVPAYYGTGTVGVTGAGIGVHMSYFLFQKFQSFDVIQNAPLLYNNHDITLVREWYGDNQIPATSIFSGTGTVGGTGDYYMVLTQDAAWPSSIMDVNRLIITTNNIPIIPEYKSTTSYLPPVGSSNNQTQSIITDFIIGRDAPFQSRGEPYVYIPSFYRLTSMQGSSPLTTFDLSILVSDNMGYIYPLYLSPGGSIDVKVLFLRKGLVN